MDDQVETHEIVKVRIREAHHVGVVCTDVQGRIRATEFAVEVLVAVDSSCNFGKSRNERKSIFQIVLPVLALCCTLGEQIRDRLRECLDQICSCVLSIQVGFFCSSYLRVLCSHDGVLLEGKSSDGKLGHRMH